VEAQAAPDLLVKPHTDMELFENIYLQIECKKETDLKGLIVQLKVRSGNKNPYYIFFPKSDGKGKSQLSRNDFIGQFEDHFEMGLMDYNGSIQTANPSIEVSLFDPTWMLNNKKLYMAWPLLKNEKPNWNSREEKYNYMVSCTNLEFKMKPFIIDIEKSTTIFIDVKQRRLNQLLH
jgi:hypothetical protein